MLFRSKKTKLTAKQKAFAENVAKGMTQADAYRQAYDTQGTKETQRQEASRTAKLPHVSATIEAMQSAVEAQKYLFPAHLRAMAIQRLTELALNTNNKPSDQLKALELIGKMSEVSLFTERKEIIKTTNTNEAREKLVNTILNAISNSKSLDDTGKSTAMTLLDEIRQAKDKSITIDQIPGDDVDQAHPLEDEEMTTPPTPTNQNEPELYAAPTHTISDKQSPNFDLEEAIGDRSEYIDRATPIEFPWEDESEESQDDPLSDLKQK